MSKKDNNREIASIETELYIKKAIRKSKIRSIIAVIVVVAIVAGGAIAWISIQKSKLAEMFAPAEPSLSGEAITSKLEASSELITSKVTLRGIADYSDGGWYVFDKGDFVMVYDSEVKAGIDIKKLKFAIDDENKIVYIYVPDAEILSIKVLPDSIKYYNESFALFNFDKKDDANKAQSLAEEEAAKDALNAGILELANSQSETLVKGILEEVVKGYDMKFLRAEKDLEKIKKDIKNSKFSTEPSTNNK